MKEDFSECSGSGSLLVVFKQSLKKPQSGYCLGQDACRHFDPPKLRRYLYNMFRRWFPQGKNKSATPAQHKGNIPEGYKHRTHSIVEVN